MKVTLITNFEGLMDYKNGVLFEAAATYTKRKTGFVYEIQIDVEEIQDKAENLGYGMVYVKRKTEENY